MSAYELQTYQSGAWKFDSYYDDRDLVLSEASRMDSAGKYMGVRVLEETFDEETQIARYATIFSRLKRLDQNSSPAKSRSAGLSAGTRNEPSQKARPGSRVIKKTTKKKQKAGAFKMIAISLFLLLLGIGALFTLQSLSRM